MNNSENIEKTIEPAFLASVFEVESEPGDATHYSYFALELPTKQEIHFMPNNSEFSFPSGIKEYQVSYDHDYSYPPKSPEVKAIIRALSITLQSDECTVLECLNTAQRIFYRSKP